MPVDVLSDVLRAVSLTGAVFFDFDLSSPWVIEAPASRDIATKVMPGAQRVIEYHLIARGAGWGHAVGQEPFRLREGDIIVFPQGDAHVLSSEPGMREPPDMKAVGRVSEKRPVAFELGGGGPDRARVVCCFLGCDERPFNPLLTALPKVIHLSTTGWLGTMMTIAASESGSENVLAAETSWLAGLRDLVIGQALTALHSQPNAGWTVDRLARTVGVSRSVLAERFAAMAGQPPMQYLALWRMQLASRMLAGGAHIAEVASAVGYESDAAFSRAFKKVVGQAPAAWRSLSRRAE